MSKGASTHSHKMHTHSTQCNKGRAVNGNYHVVWRRDSLYYRLLFHLLFGWNNRQLCGELYSSSGLKQWPAAVLLCSLLPDPSLGDGGRINAKNSNKEDKKWVAWMQWSEGSVIQKQSEVKNTTEKKKKKLTDLYLKCVRILLWFCFSITFLFFSKSFIKFYII